MAKPILFIKYPLSDCMDTSTERLTEVMKMKKQISDYHIIFAECNVNDLEIEVFNADNLDPVDIEELKKKLYARSTQDVPK